MAVKLEDYKHDAFACTRCSNCKWVDHIYIRSHRFAKICPIHTRYSFDGYSGQGMLYIARAILDGSLAWTPKLLDIIYKCTLGGACDVRCKRNLDIEVLLVIEGLRTKCVEEGYGPLEQHKAVAQKVISTGNRYGARPERRLRWLPKGVMPAQKAEILYFVGCNSSYKHPELARSTARVLQAAKIPFMVLSEEQCCGQPLLSTGQGEAAREIVDRNIRNIEASGATTVITSCAECYQTLKVEYPKLLGISTDAMSFNVLHITEYVEQLVKAGILKFSSPIDMRVTYHDPCHLGRLSEPWIPWVGVYQKFGIPQPAKKLRRGTFGVYEPPRELLRSIPGVELVEMERVKEHAWCCGAGGGVRDAFRDFALWSAGERLEEASTTGAEAIVSCCPYCEENLGEAAKENGNRIRIYDIVELMAKALSLEKV